MNLRQMSELTALISSYSSQVIDGSEKLSESALYEFWEQSRSQVGSCASFLRKSAVETESASESVRNEIWKHAEPILAEIFGSEMVIRVWSTILTAADVSRETSDSEQIVRSAMRGQMQMRHSALCLMVNWSHELDPRLQAIDRIRRRTERWTDVLIGHLAVRYGVTQFAFEPKRALDFGMDHLEGETLEPNSCVWQLIRSGLKVSFPDSLLPGFESTAHLDRMIHSLLAFFPPKLLAENGRFSAYLTSKEPDHRSVGNWHGWEASVLPFAKVKPVKDAQLSISEWHRDLRNKS